MSETQSTTAELVKAVREIASSSQIQAQITNELRKRARQIEASTAETQIQLREQTRQTDNLLVFSKGLVDTVKVFTLPSPENQDAAVKEGSLRVVQG
jgi:methyl-accepting chemotaxis protein